MTEILATDAFLQHPGVILDVRSPGEYGEGHLPGAINFPLFTDEERAQVGTCYKHQGREAAVELGFAIAGPKFAQFIRSAQSLAPSKSLRLHCWRGGMRSEAVAWVLSLAGFQVTLLQGGYKAFRRWVRHTLATAKPIQILGGMTGTGKTDVLQALITQGAQVLDLEDLANHRGSSYGALGMPPQPTTEQFENQIAILWDRFSPSTPVWIEAESRRIGLCRIPDELFLQMDVAPTVEITRSVDERLDGLVAVYGAMEPAGLIQATERIRKRLGGQRTQAAVDFLRQGDCKSAFAIILDYYDRTYRYDLERRQRTIPQWDVTGMSADAIATLLQNHYAKPRLN